jgi:hypothetical protein
MPISRRQWTFAKQSTATRTTIAQTAQDASMHHETKGIVLRMIARTHAITLIVVAIATTMTVVQQNVNVKMPLLQQ